MKLANYDFGASVKDQNSYIKLKEIGFPTKKTEEFREFNISDILSRPYELKSNTKIGISKYAKEKNFYTLFITNGIVDIAHSDLPECIGFETKIKDVAKSNNPLYYLSEAFTENEDILFINDNLDKPLKIVNIYDAKESFLPSSLHVKLKVGCKAEVIDVFETICLEDSFANINRVFYVEENSLLNYTKLQNLDLKSVLICNYIPKISQNATINSILIDLGASTSLNITDVELREKYSSFSSDGIIKLSDDKRAGNIASMVHFVEHTNSFVTCKHILDGDSRALFEVKSHVKHDAKFSKTFQNSQTILLKDGARINANPKLILDTDELEASHGATTGALDEDELYYLMSRGIDKKKSSKILINAIELQVIDKIENELVKELAQRFIEG
jgi:Fe-S cluster assembly protein SufD